MLWVAVLANDLRSGRSDHDKLFNLILHARDYVLHSILHSRSDFNYNLRPRRHNLVLTAKSLSITDRDYYQNDIQRHLLMLLYRVAQKSKLLIFAVNDINASKTRVSFAKFIAKLVEKMFDMCSIRTTVFQASIFFIKILSSLLILPIITT